MGDGIFGLCVFYRMVLEWGVRVEGTGRDRCLNFVLLRQTPDQIRTAPFRFCCATGYVVFFSFPPPSPSPGAKLG